MIKCPHCKLINPDSAQVCDCGSDFAAGHVRRSHFDDHCLAIAAAQRRLIMAMAAYVGLALLVASLAILFHFSMPLVAASGLVVLLVAAIALQRLYDLGRILGTPEGAMVLYVLGALLLGVAPVALIIFNSRATRALRKAGVKVDFLGAGRRSLGR